MHRALNRTCFLLFSIFLFLISCTYTPVGKKNTLVYCTDQEPSSYNPQVHSDKGSHNASAQTIYDRLIGFKLGSTELAPALAESWEVSKDGLVYTFHLRKNVWFHKTNYFIPTRPLNSEDVLFSFNRMRLVTHPFYQVGKSSYDHFRSLNLGSLIEEIKKIDDYTVEFTLTEKNNSFLPSLAMGFASIFSKEYGQKLMKKNQKEKIDLQPVGTGPFIFQRHVKGKMIRFRSNPSYFNGAAKYKELIFAIIPDAKARIAKTTKNECHLMAEPPFENIKDIEANHGLNLMQSSGMNISYLAFNVNKEPFTSPLVRRAIQLAVNREKIIAEVFRGYAELASSPVPPIVWGTEKPKGLKVLKQNQEESKKLLRQAGFENGFSTKIWIPSSPRPYIPHPKKMAESLKKDLYEVGIQVEIVELKWKEFEERTSKGEHEMGLFGWVGDNGDPDNFLYQLLSCESVEGGLNKSRWCHSEYTQLVTEARHVQPQAKRDRLYQKALNVFQQEVPWVPMAHVKHFLIFKDDVQGQVIDPRGLVTFRRLEIQ